MVIMDVLRKPAIALHVLSRMSTYNFQFCVRNPRLLKQRAHQGRLHADDGQEL